MFSSLFRLCQCRIWPIEPAFSSEHSCAQSSHQDSPAYTIYKHQGFSQYLLNHLATCMVMTRPNKPFCQFSALPASCLPDLPFVCLCSGAQIFTCCHPHPAEVCSDRRTWTHPFLDSTTLDSSKIHYTFSSVPCLNFLTNSTHFAMGFRQSVPNSISSGIGLM